MGRPMNRVRRILHPSDFSHASGGAFAKAVEMAKASRAALLLVHVMTSLGVGRPLFGRFSG
jgi:nucleotide-binding universal stress UspA family protein